MPKPADDVEQHGEHHADEDGGRYWEIERRVLPTIENIAGQASERHVRPTRQSQYDANADNDHTHDDQQFSQIGHTLIVAESKGESLPG